MQTSRKQIVSYFLIIAITFYVSQLQKLVQTAFAASSPPVVINEIAWAGSKDDSNDEWIELFNATDQPIDLSGWKIVDDQTTTYAITAGIIPSKGYFLIEDKETAVNSIVADALIGLSLANTGDRLELFDVNNASVDLVNSQGAAWFAGDNEEKRTMERKDSYASGDNKDNWKSNSAASGATASLGSIINGTPKGQNSPDPENTTPVAVIFTADKQFPQSGETVNISAETFDAQKLFSYGFELSYDPTVIQFESAHKGTFLNNSGNIQTSFQTGLENNQPGTLLVAEAITSENEKNGLSGNGLLFKLTFEVIGQPEQETTIEIGDQSFMADPQSDLNALFQDVEIVVASEGSETQVKNPRVTAAQQRYALNISWEKPEVEVDEYIVLRKNAANAFEELGRTSETSFTDSKNIIPNLEYAYQIISVKDNQNSQPVAISGSETRGITGDNNRTDRVDGRDLQNLANEFGATQSSQNFKPLVDTTYDGRIDGNDLIDIAANWAKVYQP